MLDFTRLGFGPQTTLILGCLGARVIRVESSLHPDPIRVMPPYAPEAGDFIALEPVTHMTDAFNRAARGERDTGTRVLAPGAAFSCTMEIEVRPLP